MRSHRLRSSLLATAIAAIGALALSSVSAAAACPGGTVPSGNSEVDQYVETIPDSCGDTQGGGSEQGGGSGSSGGGSGSSGGGEGDATGAGPIPKSTADELQSLGTDGAATENLAAATSPEGSGATGNGSSDGSGDTSSGSDGAPPSSLDAGSGDGSAISAVASSLGGDDEGLGPLLPLILLAVLLCALAGGLMKRRADRTSPR